MIRRILITVGAMVLLAVAGWYVWRTFGTTPISEIVESPRDFEGRQVTVAGEVTSRVGILSFNTFTVADDSGELRVLTHRAPPKNGAKIRVRGTVESSMVVGNWQQVVLVEPR